MGRFTGKVALITGSSNGIGRATAILFVSEGAKVTITGRDPKALQETKAECLKKGAATGDILDILGDITSDETRTVLVKETIKRFGKLDILVNNHGGSLKEQDEKGNLDVDAFDAVMSLNCKSTLAMSLKAMPHLKATKGCIVNVSSIASSIPTVPNPFYAMSKASLDHLTKILAVQNAKDGIRVNCVNPGFVRTAFFAKLGMSDEIRDQMMDIVKRTMVPTGHLGVPEDIAHLIAFLSDNTTAAYITGQAMVIDGGTSLMHASGSNPEMDSFMNKLRSARADTSSPSDK